MGFFKDLKTLNNQAKDLRVQYPVDQQIANAQNSMAQANAMMAQMAQGSMAATNAMTTGVDAIATVTAAQQTGAMMNYNPVVELQLLVTMPNGVPMPVTRQEMVMQIHLSRCQPGQRLKVKVNPANPNELWIDWVTPV